MPELTTSYLGMELDNPLVVSPSPLCDNVDNLKRMEEAGAAAIVLHSLFEEQLTHDSNALNENLMQGAETYGESLSYFPDQGDYKMGPDSYLDHLRRAKDAVSLPVIASLNGVSKGGWTECAKQLEQAGADAIELNTYFIPTSPDMTGTQVREMTTDLVRDVKSQVSIPVAVKVGPYFTAMANVATALSEAGADGLVLFNRFYQPDLDLDNLEVVPNLELSSPSELRLRLRWIAILYGRIEADLAVTGGIHGPEDAVKALMAGANVTMTTSALLKYGISHLAKLRRGLVQWMEEHEYESVEMMQGSMSQKSVGDPAAFERANYMRVLNSFVPGM